MKKLKKLIELNMKKFTLLLLAMPFFAQSQTYLRCGSELVNRQYQNTDNSFLEKQQQIFERAKQWADANQRSISQSEEVLQIPVVVHVIYENDEENLSDVVIKSQIDVLNEDMAEQIQTPQKLELFLIQLLVKPSFNFI